MILEKVVVGPVEVNCYILGANTGEAIVIDPGAEPQKIVKRLKRHNLRIKCIVNTHGHIDHIGANACLGAPVFIHRQDVEFLHNPRLNLSAMLGLAFTPSSCARGLEDGDRIEVGDISLQVMHTPGHTPGGICLHTGKFCFTGDTLFAQGLGRTDIPGASEEELRASIHTRLFTLPEDTVIYPGHGPASSIGKEKEVSPFI